MKQYIIFHSRDEIQRLEMDCIVYFEAEGNYTNIFLRNGLKVTVGSSLTNMEENLTRQLGQNASIFMRLGKRYIINRNYILSVQVLRQQLTLSDGATFSFRLTVSKEALRRLRELLLKTYKINS